MSHPVVLGVFAHPDDESFLCGGTMAALADRGFKVALVTCTGGENATQVGRRLTRSALKRVRRRELQQSSEILGIKDIHVLNYPDKGLHRVPPERLINRLMQFLTRYRPDFVFTFTPDGISNHGDHQTISRVTKEALRRWNRKSAARASLCLFGFPNTFRKIINLPDVRAQRFLRFDVRRYVRRKIRAIAMHKSQVKTMERYRHLGPQALRRLFHFEYVLRDRGSSGGAELHALLRRAS